MKKLTFLFVAAMITSAAFGQGSLDNEFYFRGGISSPSWGQYGGSQSDWDDMFGITEKKGFMGEIGSIFMLKSIPMPDGMALGINADYFAFYYNKFQGNGIDLYSLRFDSKIGPSFSYSPVEKLAFDVYGKLDINWFTGTYFTAEDLSIDEAYAGLVNLGFSTGLNFRFSVLMLGIEYNMLSAKLISSESENEDDYIGDKRFGGTSDKTPLSSFNITFGFSF